MPEQPNRQTNRRRTGHDDVGHVLVANEMTSRRRTNSRSLAGRLRSPGHPGRRSPRQIRLLRWLRHRHSRPGQNSSFSIGSDAFLTKKLKIKENITDGGSVADSRQRWRQTSCLRPSMARNVRFRTFRSCKADKAGQLTQWFEFGVKDF